MDPGCYVAVTTPAPFLQSDDFPNAQLRRNMTAVATQQLAREVNKMTWHPTASMRTVVGGKRNRHDHRVV